MEGLLGPTHLNALVTPGESNQFPPFAKPFLLTDIVMSSEVFEQVDRQKWAQS